MLSLTLHILMHRYLPVLFLLSLTPLSIANTELSTPNINDIDYPNDDPPSPLEIELGKMLFFDPRLSRHNNLSCSSCHNPDSGMSDNMTTSLGDNSKPLSRNSPHLYNLAWSALFFWDGRASSLEQQVLMPISDDSEMDMPLKRLLPKLQNIPYYRKQFESIYNTPYIGKTELSLALAAFIRSIVSNNSPFDQYLAGNQNALSPAAQRGLRLFKGKAQCIECHDGPNLTNDSFHSLGFDDEDKGRGKIVPNSGMDYRFKTPGLRNVTLTAPYMHHGTLKDLESVIQFYNQGGGNAPHKDKLIKPLHLNNHELADLIAFLSALTDPVTLSRPIIP